MDVHVPCSRELHAALIQCRSPRTYHDHGYKLMPESNSYQLYLKFVMDPSSHQTGYTDAEPEERSGLYSGRSSIYQVVRLDNRRMDVHDAIVTSSVLVGITTNKTAVPTD